MPVDFRGRPMPRLRVRAEFTSPDLDEESGVRGDAWPRGAAERFLGLVQHGYLYTERLEGTDIVITLRLQTSDTALLGDVMAALPDPAAKREFKNQSPPPGGAGDDATETADAFSALLDEMAAAFEASAAADPPRGLLKFEADLKASLARGWKPPWSGLAPKLTDEEIASLSTDKLTDACFSSGLAARTLLLYEDPTYCLRRLQVLYPAFRELFARKDAWRIVPGALAMHAGQLDASVRSTINVNAFMGVSGALDLYQVKGYARKLAGHERELIAAHLNVLKKMSGYLRDVARIASTAEKKPYVCTRTPVQTANWALVLVRRISPDEYDKIRRVVAKAYATGRNPGGEDITRYIDAVAPELAKFLGEHGA